MNQGWILQTQSSMLNYWLLMDSEIGAVIVFSYGLTENTTRLQWTERHKKRHEWEKGTHRKEGSLQGLGILRVYWGTVSIKHYLHIKSCWKTGVIGGNGWWIEFKYILFIYGISKEWNLKNNLFDNSLTKDSSVQRSKRREILDQIISS